MRLERFMNATTRTVRGLKRTRTLRFVTYVCMVRAYFIYNVHVTHRCINEAVLASVVDFLPAVLSMNCHSLLASSFIAFKRQMFYDDAL